MVEANRLIVGQSLTIGSGEYSTLLIHHVVDKLRLLIESAVCHSHLAICGQPIWPQHVWRRARVKWRALLERSRHLVHVVLAERVRRRWHPIAYIVELGAWLVREFLRSGRLELIAPRKALMVTYHLSRVGLVSSSYLGQISWVVEHERLEVGAVRGIFHVSWNLIVLYSTRVAWLEERSLVG